MIQATDADIRALITKIVSAEQVCRNCAENHERTASIYTEALTQHVNARERVAKLHAVLAAALRSIALGEPMGEFDCQSMLTVLGKIGICTYCNGAGCLYCNKQGITQTEPSAPEPPA